VSRIASKRALAIVGLVSGVLGFNALIAQSHETKKEWRFPMGSGETIIAASTFLGDNGKPFTSMEIYSTQGAAPTLSQEANFLGFVLDNLPKGTNLSFIQSRLSESEARKRLAEFAAGSADWKRVARTGNVPVIYPLVIQLLNKSSSYREWNEAFLSRGMHLYVAGVEKVGLERFAKTGATCPAGTNCTNLVAPADAMIQMNIDPLATH
jgi:hypothetical protein